MTSANGIHELFPTPVQFVQGLLDVPTVAAAIATLRARELGTNGRSAGLGHSDTIEPGTSPAFDRVAARLLPAVTEFGALLLGEPLDWAIKEMWGNVLQAGGHQSLHNHANCLVSGVVYLTSTRDASRTAFLRGLGGQDFKFSHRNARTHNNAYNAERWLAPAAEPGDALLFPSYMLHEVPPNPAGVRITLAFNAIPSRLDCWGYQVGLTG
jgi:uncharacterized protein (TIGR02466 family)